MFFLAYNILSVFLLIPVVLYHLYRSISRGRPPALGERFGIISKKVLASLKQKPVIWLHAVSVGESIAARPLLKAIRAHYPSHTILVSNTTETGRTISSTFGEIDHCIYFPFDFLPAVRYSLQHIRPKLIIIMETEIWPNFTLEANRRGIPVLLANGRISDRSFSRYRKFSWFFRHALQRFSCLCMQSEADLDRIIAIGAPPQNTLVGGNLKYDIPFKRISEEGKNYLRIKYSIPANLTVITAASTHPGEEECILSSYRDLAVTFENLFLVLVPRHPERAGEVAVLTEKTDMPFCRRTALKARGESSFKAGEVLLVDTIGEMMDLYALSDLAFVGGSLVPTGGHNLLEPASLGIPTIFGPHMSNFREITGLVLRYGAGIQLESPDTLSDTLRTLISNETLRHVLGQNGLKLMRDNGGATARHLNEIGRYL